MFVSIYAIDSNGDSIVQRQRSRFELATKRLIVPAVFQNRLGTDKSLSFLSFTAFIIKTSINLLKPRKKIQQSMTRRDAATYYNGAYFGRCVKPGHCFKLNKKQTAKQLAGYRFNIGSSKASLAALYNNVWAGKTICACVGQG